MGVGGYTYILKIPVLSECCFFVPLNTATWIIAVSGLIPTVVCFILASPSGNEFLRIHGLPASYSPFIEYVYGILGVAIGSCSAMLFVGSQEEMLTMYYIMYLWIMPFYIAGSFAAAIFIASETAQTKFVKFGVTYLLLGMAQVVVHIYFWIVIKSRLFVKKAENNVVNINITIV